MDSTQKCKIDDNLIRGIFSPASGIVFLNFYSTNVEFNQDSKQLKKLGKQVNRTFQLHVMHNYKLQKIKKVALSKWEVEPLARSPFVLYIQSKQRNQSVKPQKQDHTQTKGICCVYIDKYTCTV